MTHKRLGLFGLAVFLVLPAFANALFTDNSAPPIVTTIAMVVLAAEIILVILISLNIVKFLNITKKNKLIRIIYFTIGMFLFNSVFNLLYFVSSFVGWSPDYIYIYIIERLIITAAFVMILIGFLKFNKILRIKV